MLKNTDIYSHKLTIKSFKINTAFQALLYLLSKYKSNFTLNNF